MHLTNSKEKQEGKIKCRMALIWLHKTQEIKIV